MKTRFFSIILILASALVAQDISSRILIRFDVTSKKLYSLSEKTLNILKGLDGSRLGVTAFLDEDEFGRSDAENLLLRYKSSYKGLDVRFISPTKNPGLVAEYKIGSHSTLVWDYHGRRIKTTGLTEEDFSNGIYALLNPRSPVVYITTGHGEKSVSKEFSALSRIMGEENYQFSELLLQKSGGIPEDADCLIIPGPKKDFLRKEIELIDTYLRRGGRLLVLLDPYADGGFGEILSSYGIRLASDVVIDSGSKMFGGDELFPMSVEYPEHPVTRSITGICMFPVARSILPETKLNPRFSVRPLAKTSEKAYGETDRNSVSKGTAVFDPENDEPGPLVLAVAAEYRDDDFVNDGLLVLIGDSDFISNPYIGLAGNKDFFLNSLAWLTGSGELIGIRTVGSANHPIILSQGQGLVLALIVLGLLPGAFAALGIIAWWRRRRSP